MDLKDACFINTLKDMEILGVRHENQQLIEENEKLKKELAAFKKKKK